MCNDDGRLDLNDDSKDGEWCCDAHEAQFAMETMGWEPPEQPHPRELIPEVGELPIEVNKPHTGNVMALMKAFAITIHHMRTRAVVEAPLTEADVMIAIKQLWRSFAAETVVQRIHVNQNAAVSNKVLILHHLETLIDEVLKIDTPLPKVN